MPFDPAKLAAVKAQGQSSGFDPAKLQALKNQPGLTQRAFESMKRGVTEGPALPIAGSIAAGLATGGLGLIPAAGAAALGAGGGEAYRQLIQQMRGRGPATSKEAASGIAGEAGAGALGELGGRAAVGAIKAVGRPIVSGLKNQFLPAALSTFSGVSRPAAELGINAPQSILMAKNTYPEAAQEILGKVKQTLIQARQKLGEGVGAAIENLDAQLNGAKIVDASDIASTFEKPISKTPGIPAKAKEILARFKSQSSFDPITGASIPEKQSIADLYQAKRELQYLTDFGTMDPTGNVLQKMDKNSPARAPMKAMIKAINNKIVETEEKVLGTSNVAKANSEFSKNARIYDFIEKNLLRGEAGQPETRAAALFKKGANSPRARAMTKVEAMLPQEQQFLGPLNETLAAQELEPGIGRNMLRTGTMGLALAGLSRLDPAALALAPFFSPRYGTAYSRGIAGLAQGGLNKATGPAAKSVLQGVFQSNAHRGLFNR